MAIIGDDPDRLMEIQIANALYPIFYPIEQQDWILQEKHFGKCLRVARKAWKEFNSNE